MRVKGPRRLKTEILCYFVNGAISTLIHFGVLAGLLEYEVVGSAGLANLVASLFGISSSFLGSRYFVFRGAEGHVADHGVRFVGLYAVIAFLNGLILFVWTDVCRMHYQSGFLIVMLLQFVLSFFGNKLFVFRDNCLMCTKLTRFLLATVTFILIMLGLNLAHNQFMTVDVVFYAAIEDAVLAASLAGSLLIIGPYFQVFCSFEKTQILLIWLLGGYAFAISVPTVIDRSLSFYILEKLEQRGGGILQGRIKDVFTEEYLPEHRLVDVRLTEQLQSGTIEIVEGCVRLTAKGQRLANFSRFYRQNLLPKHRLLMGEYTDDLTNPFRNSRNDFDYQCQ